MKLVMIGGGGFRTPLVYSALLRDRADEYFFRRIRSTAVVALYDQAEVWELLGYEGSSFDKGGYLHRGFDDLDWLPDPRVEEYDGEPHAEFLPDELGFDPPWDGVYDT